MAKIITKFITDLAVTTAKIADSAITNVKVSATAAIAESKLALDFSTSSLNSAISTVSGNLATHVADTANPHSVTKAQVGLGNVTNDAQLKAADLDIDGTLAANSDTKIPSQKAVKTYADTKIASSEKGAASGVCPLDATSKIASAYLPSYVDDVLEFADQAAFPVTGETGKIYVSIATGETFRWSGTVYVEIATGDVASVNAKVGVVVLTTDDISDSGQTNKWATAAEKTKLGFITVTQAVDLDTVESDLSGHIANTSNPHSVTKTQVGLGNVTNDAQLKVADLDIDGTLAANSDTKIPSQKAVKTYADGVASAASSALSAHTGNTSNPHSVTKAQVGLGNVDNVQQLPMSYLDIDGTLAANSDVKVPSQKAVKSYVASQLATMHVPALDRIVLSAQNITDQFVDLSFAAISAASIQVVPVGGPVQDPGSDFSVSLTGGSGGVTRVSFLGDLAAQLVAGDILLISFSK